MLDLKKNLTIEKIVALLVIVVIFSFAVILSQRETNLTDYKPSIMPKAVELLKDPSSSPIITPVVIIEPVKKRFLSGIIKEIKKTSIIISDPTNKNTEVGFNYSTEFIKGNNVDIGEKVSRDDLAVGLVVGIFLSEDEKDNVALKIQLIRKTN